jgi:hypothetical protein
MTTGKNQSTKVTDYKALKKRHFSIIPSLSTPNPPLKRAGRILKAYLKICPNLCKKIRHR